MGAIGSLVLGVFAGVAAGNCEETEDYMGTISDAVEAPPTGINHSDERPPIPEQTDHSAQGVPSIPAAGRIPAPIMFLLNMGIVPYLYKPRAAASREPRERYSLNH